MVSRFEGQAAGGDTQPLIRLASNGHARANAAWGLEPSNTGATACQELGLILGLSAALNAIRVVAREHGYVASATVTIAGEGGEQRNATAMGPTDSVAIVEAVAHAIEPTGNILVAVARRLAELDETLTATVLDHHGVQIAVGPDAHSDIHARLVALLPGPGRLAAETPAAAVRLCCLEDCALVITTTPEASCLAQVERALEQIEIRRV
jgi:hypothetical protein